MWKNIHKKPLLMKNDNVSSLIAPFVLPGAVLLFSILYMLYVNHELRMALLQIEHNNAVALNIERTLSTIKDTETGLKAYVYNNDTAFLRTYRQAKNTFPNQLDLLQYLTATDKRRAETFDKAREFLGKRMILLDSIISLANKDTVNRYQMINLMTQAWGMMDKSRTLLIEISEEEKEAILKLNLTKEHHTFQVRLLQGILIFLSIGLLAAAFWRLAGEVTRKQEYEQQLKNTVMQLEAHTQELENFNYMMAHHLQEPLRKMGTFSDRLNTKYGPDLPKEGQHLTERLHYLSATASRIIEEFRLLVTIQGSRREQYTSKVDLNQVLQKVKQQLSSLITETRASIKIHSPLPVVYGHKEQLTLVFYHIIENSLLFRKEDAPPEVAIAHEIITISRETSDTQPQQQYKITFSDRGIGFDMSFKDKIFEMFHRLDAEKHQLGMGTGLAFCKKIMAQHHGSIEAQSTVGEGTTIVLFLPFS